MIIGSTTYQPIPTITVPDKPAEGSGSGASRPDQMVSGNSQVKEDSKLIESSKADRENEGRKEELSAKEKKRLQKLKRRDQEVRRHEEAHITAGGTLVKSGPHYEYVTGPDGKQYAVNGYVNIDVSPEKEPEQTIRKADRIVKAALAPANPSSDDYAIASNARRMKARALQQIRELEQQDQNEKMAEQAYDLGKSLSRDKKEYQPTSSYSQVPQVQSANVTMTA